jgi:S1-C subfamily serine protease
MLRMPLVVLLAFLPTAAIAADVTIQEAMLRAKPAVAMVVSEVAAAVTLACPQGDVRVAPPAFRETGTGWFVDPRGWIVTNGHVVSPAHRPPEWLAAQLGQKAARPGCRIANVALDPSVSVILSNGRRLPASIVKYSPPVVGEEMSGQDLALLRVHAADLPSLPPGDSSALQIGDRLHVIGFPGVVLTHELLNASAKVEASVTNGAVSGFKQDRAGQPVIQTDAPAAWGNSGGPAVDDRGRVVGVLTFVTLSAGEQGTIVQGFNFVIPVQAVRDFVKGTDVNLDERGRFNAAWYAGLGDFFAGEHARARTALAEADRLMPELPDVRRVAAENTEKIRNLPPRPFPWAFVAAAVSAVSLAAYGWILTARWKRNRFRVGAADVMKLLDSPTPPLILDVRDAVTYAKSPVRIPNARHVTPDALAASERSPLDVDPDRTLVAYCT